MRTLTLLARRQARPAGAERGAGAPASDGERGSAGTKSPGSESDGGTTLVETIVALTVLVVAIVGLLGMVTLTAKLTEDQGHLAARATEYAQDKMEQLLALKYGDSTSNTAVFPATPAGGTGLTIGGSSNASAAASGYVDWLDNNGNLLVSNGVTEPANWFYKRVWQVSSPAANLKQVTVTTTVKFSMSRTELPTATVTALKTFPF